MSGIKDVAKRAGVSISTVSNVLNKSKYVSPELVKRVEEAVEELSYEVNPIARSMKSNRSGTIGVIVEDVCGMFYPYVVKGINSVMEEKGYQLIICDTQGGYGDREALKREQELLRRLLANRVDGILFVSMIQDEKKAKYLTQIRKLANKYKRTPLVSLERDFTAAGIDSVYFDSYENAKMAMKHLLDCGCRKIAHITGPMIMEIAQDRVRGYKDSMKEHCPDIDFDRMIAYGDYSHQSGYMAMKKLMEDNPVIDGVFCGNDQMAIGAVKYLKEQGIRIPEDIKIIGYDDVFISSVVEPALSTIHIQKRHAGIEAARILIQRIEQSAEEEGSPIGVKMESRLVVRASTDPSAPEDWILSDW
ncbi:MAG: LacI family DNA-binding transcriptional regulator [Eubacteriales bacterium]|nr:LacI family DNA-binding transcriptional regulator [Eubacteriales bacterium]